MHRPSVRPSGSARSWLLLLAVALLTLALWFRIVLDAFYQEGYHLGARGLAALRQEKQLRRTNNGRQ
jgi:hypothetical protein